MVWTRFIISMYYRFASTRPLLRRVSLYYLNIKTIFIRGISYWNNLVGGLRVQSYSSSYWHLVNVKSKYSEINKSKKK